MLTFLLVVLALLAVAIAPVMYTARALGAERTSIGWIILLLIVQTATMKFVEALAIPDLIGFIVSFFACAFVIQQLLGTTYKRALIISVVSSVITFVALLLLVKLLGGKPTEPDDLSLWAVSNFSSLA